MRHSAVLASPYAARHHSWMVAPLVVALICLMAPASSAQTFTVLHTFTGSSDGAYPYAGLMLDASGNLYGSASEGALGYGAIFKVTNRSNGWILTPLYAFHQSDGADPESPGLFGRDGALYGTTRKGGQGGIGTIFRLTPQPAHCSATLCTWNETVLYEFTGGPDGMWPQGHLTSDQAGNLYGTTTGMPVLDQNPLDGGPPGSVWQLARSGLSWNFNIVHAFSNYGGDGTNPKGGLVVDSLGNVYGTTPLGGVFNNGTVFQMKPTASGWSEQILYNFYSAETGVMPQAGLVADHSGNMFGVTFIGADAFEMTRSGGVWNYASMCITSTGNGPFSELAIDAQGNLYGATLNGGRYNQGNVFKLFWANGVWNSTDLYDFTGADDGGQPFGSVAVDTAGIIYGTAAYGGSHGYGTVWMLTQ